MQLDLESPLRSGGNWRGRSEKDLTTLFDLTNPLYTGVLLSCYSIALLLPGLEVRFLCIRPDQI